MTINKNAPYIYELIIQLSYESSIKYNEYYEKISRMISKKTDKVIFINSNLITFNVSYIKTKFGTINCYSFQTISMNSNKPIDESDIKCGLEPKGKNKVFTNILLKNDFDQFIKFFNIKNIIIINEYINNNIISPDMSFVLSALCCKTRDHYDVVRKEYIKYYNSNKKEQFIIKLMREPLNKVNLMTKILMESYHYAKHMKTLNEFISNNKDPMKYYLISGCYTQFEPFEQSVYENLNDSKDIDLDDLILMPVCHSVLYIYNCKNDLMMYDPDDYIVPNKKFKMFNDLGYGLKLLYKENPIQSINRSDMYCLFHCLRFMMFFCDNINVDNNIDIIIRRTEEDIMKIKNNIIKGMINWILVLGNYFEDVNL